MHVFRREVAAVQAQLAGEAEDGKTGSELKENKDPKSGWEKVDNSIE